MVKQRDVRDVRGRSASEIGGKAKAAADGPLRIVAAQSAMVPPKVRRTTAAAFAGARQDRFFEILSATSNVLLACATVGVSSHTVYKHRRTDPAFAARWNRALADAIADLKMKVAAQGRFGQTTETVFDITANGERRVRKVREVAPLALRTLVAAAGDADASDRADQEAAEREAREIKLEAAERILLAAAERARAVHRDDADG